MIAKCLVSFIFLLAGFTVSTAYAAPAMLVNMVVSGTLDKSADGKMLPANGDQILAVNVGTGVTEATGVYTANDKFGGGVFSVLMTNKDQNLNGTQLVLKLSHLNTVYNLQNSAGSDALFTFNGSFLPIQATINLVMSNLNATTTSGSASTSTANSASTSTANGTHIVYVTAPASGVVAPIKSLQPPLAALPGDLNADGAVDSVDINLLKQAISGQIALNKTTMDVNADGVVNTRDLIDLIRIVRNASAYTPGIIVVKPSAILVVPAAITNVPVSIIRTPASIVQGR